MFTLDLVNSGLDCWNKIQELRNFKGLFKWMLPEFLDVNGCQHVCQMDLHRIECFYGFV